MSFIELWKTFAALHASCRIFWSSHFPRLTNSPTRITPLMIFRLQFSFQLMVNRSMNMIVVTITKSWIILKISGSICATTNSNAAPKIRNAMFITMLSKRKVTRLATTLPLVPHCSLFTMYIRQTSPLTDSAGIRMSMNMAYQTKI